MMTLSLNETIYFILSPFVLAAFSFWGLMIFLRARNFDKYGNRIKNWRRLSPELLSEQIEYHNNAVYKAFELFIKITLAIFGGVSFIALTQQDNKLNTKVLIEAGGIIMLVVSALFSVVVIAHQKAKIERWKKSFKWYHPFLWNECWFVDAFVVLSVFANFVLIPKLICNLQCM